VTIYRFAITLSDVDRGVYQTLDLRAALHPSETMRWLVLRALAYCLSYEEGIAFSKGGLSEAEEPPLSVHDLTGVRRAWIDLGVPSAERLHKAAKATAKVVIYTHAEVALLQKEAASRPIHKVEAIEVWHVPASFLDAIEKKLDRTTALELVRSDGQLYATIGGATLDAPIVHASLVIS
jgi:uncharacterized protein YaeQ